MIDILNINQFAFNKLQHYKTLSEKVYICAALPYTDGDWIVGIVDAKEANVRYTGDTSKLTTMTLTTIELGITFPKDITLWQYKNCIMWLPK